MKTKLFLLAFMALMSVAAMATGSSLIPHPSSLDTVPVTKRGVTPPRNLWNYDQTQAAGKYGQMLAVKRYSSAVGDTLLGYVPVYYMDGNLFIESHTVIHSGNLPTYTASNGLTKTGYDFKLGGTFAESTTFNSGTYDMTWNGEGLYGYVQGNGYSTGGAAVWNLYNDEIALLQGSELNATEASIYWQAEGSFSNDVYLLSDMNRSRMGYWHMYITGSAGRKRGIEIDSTGIEFYVSSSASYLLPSNAPSFTNGVKQVWVQTGTGTAATAAWENFSTGTGTVTSVALSMPTGFSVSGSPITSNGTLAVTTTLTGVVQGNGSGLTASLGTANQLLRTNAGGTAAEWFTPSYLTANQTITLSGAVTGSGTTSITTTLAALGATSSGQVLTWNGTAWAAAAPTGGVSGSGTNNYMTKWAGSTSLSNSIVFDNGTNIGIGTSAPSHKFIIEQDINNKSYSFVSYNANSGNQAQNRMQLWNNLGKAETRGGAWFLNGSNVTGVYSNAMGYWNYENGPIILAANSQANFWLLPNGNVAIGGISTATEKLQLDGNFTLTGVIKNANGTAAAPAYAFTNDLDVGMYRIDVNRLGFATNGILRVEFGASGQVLFNGSAGTSGQVLTSAGASSPPTWTTISGGLPSGTSGQTLRHDGTNWVASSLLTNDGTTIDFTGTNAINLTSGTTAQRPTAAAALFRYNSSGENLEYSNGTSWFTLVQGSGSANSVPVWTSALGLTNDASDFTYNTSTNVLTLAGSIQNASGSLSAPTYTFSGDSNTGLYNPGADILAIATGGVERIYWDNQGKARHVAAANTLSMVMNTMYFDKSAAAADDDEIAFPFNLDDSGGTETTFGRLRVIADNVTNGSEAGHWAFDVMVGGTLTNRMNIIATEVNTSVPFKTAQYTATAASALTPQNGWIIYVTSTNGTFTSVGHWARENGAWVKL